MAAMTQAGRRQFLASALAAASAASAQSQSKATLSKLGIPGPWPGRVVAVEHPRSIVSGAYQAEPIRDMMRKGMMELTGAPGWLDAWRMLFEKGDVVGIKVSPVGGPNLSSDATVLNEIIQSLEQAGVPHRDVLVINRYGAELQTAGIDKWLPADVRWEAASPAYDEVQLDMGGYDRDQYMEMALVKPGEDMNDSRYRRSHVAKFITQRVNKFINLPVLKHHQSAGVTIALKNMSHGLVNNVNRSHMTPTSNACGAFIPAVVSLPVMRAKAVLHICDGVKASFHGGPGGRAQFIWEHKTMYFATDPVALDKTGWKAIDAVALSKPDQFSHFLNCQVEHIEIAGQMGLGTFDDKKINVRRLTLA
jgi:hypothetical protein